MCVLNLQADYSSLSSQKSSAGCWKKCKGLTKGIWLSPADIKTPAILKLKCMSGLKGRDVVKCLLYVLEIGEGAMRQRGVNSI